MNRRNRSRRGINRQASSQSPHSLKKFRKHIASIELDSYNSTTSFLESAHDDQNCEDFCECIANNFALIPCTGQFDYTGLNEQSVNPAHCDQDTSHYPEPDSLLSAMYVLPPIFYHTLAKGEGQKQGRRKKIS